MRMGSSILAPTISSNRKAGPDHVGVTTQYEESAVVAHEQGFRTDVLRRNILVMGRGMYAAG